MDKETYTYCVPENCEDSRYSFESMWDESSPNYLAEDAAQDYHQYHDGWEDSWPLTFRVFGSDGESLGDFEVDRETTPTFRAISA